MIVMIYTYLVDFLKTSSPTPKKVSFIFVRFLGRVITGSLQQQLNKNKIVQITSFTMW